jgi:hypothetical protein
MGNMSRTHYKTINHIGCYDGWVEFPITDISRADPGGDFSHEIPQTFSRLPSLGAIFLPIINDITVSTDCKLVDIYSLYAQMQGRIQDFKLECALKKIAPSEGRRENVWGISCEKSPPGSALR